MHTTHTCDGRIEDKDRLKLTCALFRKCPHAHITYTRASQTHVYKLTHTNEFHKGRVGYREAAEDNALETMV